VRHNSVVVVVGAVLASVLVTGCGSGGQAPSQSAAVVKTAYNKTLKKTILVNGSGLTLYLYTGDRNGVSACAKDPGCAMIWPALKPGGHATAGAGVKSALLGTTANGKQVTYNGHPLYTFRGGRSGGGLPDRKPGQVNGQGFAYTWWVVSPKGNAIKTS
jgi:predicted lipoprotein with Yx(FWY)xxD motif